LPNRSSTADGISSAEAKFCVYSMLSSEWPAHRSAFEAWLDSGNFEAGRQLRSVAEIRVGLGAVCSTSPSP
jgi:hypothetical protein